MPIDTNWDIDYYKTDYESEEHWNLRKRFMEVHKDKFSEDELVCLAQVFTNVEFMGCKYPDETMRLVGELSQDVAKEFRAKRALKLQRTFVKASDAAEARAKAANNGKRAATGGLGFLQQDNLRTHQPKTKKDFKSHLFERMKYGNFVLYLIGGRNCLQVSGTRCSVQVQEKEVPTPGKKKFEIFINNRLTGRAVADNIKIAKAEAFETAMKELREHCFSIKINPDADCIDVNKSKDGITAGVKQREVVEEKKIESDNIGYKMMKAMGWSGGGLGSTSQGREEPVGYLLKINRHGLGSAAEKLDKKYFNQILLNYVKSDDIRDLHFESTFTKDERALLHDLAGKAGLKSSSYGKGESRSLVVSKKNITTEQILTEVLINQTPSYCNKYFVQVPPSRAKEFPNHTAELELQI